MYSTSMTANPMGDVPSTSTASDQHAPKRRRTGAETQPREALHGPTDGVDRPEDAEVGMMQLETEEVLSDLTLQHDEQVAANAVIQRLIHDLPKLPTAEVDGSSVKGFLKDVNFTLEKPFVFQPPARVQVVGSHAINATCRPSPAIDIAVQIPTTCLDSKDQLNHRYHAKRVLYLSHLRKTLSKLPGVEAVEWTPGVGSDPRKPALLLHLTTKQQSPPTASKTKKSKTTAAEGISIRILPALAVDAFPLSKLAPNRNNLRTAADTQGQQLPTPRYNASVLVDMLMCNHASVLKETAAAVPGFASAVVLLKTWARQQRLMGGADGLSGFFLTMGLVCVLQKGQATPSMSPIHLFRATLQALSTTKPFITGSALKHQHPSTTSSSSSSSPPAIKAFRSPTKNTAVLIDPSGYLNIGRNISSAALQQTADAASRTAAVVPGGGPDAFDAAFFLQRPLSSLFDLWYHVTIPISNSSGLGSDIPVWRRQEDKVREILVKALTDRAVLVRCIGRTISSTNATTTNATTGKKKGQQGYDPKYGAASVETHSQSILVGIRVDATAALRTIDQGPSADSGDAAKTYREFWGAKSELRRFVDGSIREALVWECPLGQRHLVVDMLVEYIVTRHFPSGTVVQGKAGLLDKALRCKGRTPSDDLEDERACSAAADRLGKKLRAVSGLPLRIVTVQPLAATLRHAALFPPFPHPLAGAPGGVGAGDVDSVPRCLEPVELLCQLEGTGRWPDAVEPYEKMKAAVGVQLALELQRGFGIEAQATEDYVDVLTDGFAFRLRLGGERDEIMQKKALLEAGISHPPPHHDIPLRVWHQGIVSATAASNPAFQPALRFAKRWTTAHLLSPHIPEEAVELLTVAAFRPEAVTGNAPTTALVGFLRFLLLLGNHPWSVQPLVLGGAAGEPVTAQQRGSAAAAHAQLRQSGGGVPAMFITGPQSDMCVGWTREVLSVQMLWRATVLAARSATYIEQALCSTSQTNNTDNDTDTTKATNNITSKVFSQDLEDYDVIIRLRPDAVPFTDRSLVSAKTSSTTATTKTTTVSNGEQRQLDKRCRAILKGIPTSVVRSRGPSIVRKELLVGFEPVKIFVTTLQQRFNSVATVCADYSGGLVVAMKWLPSVLRPGVVVAERAHALKPASLEREEEFAQGTGTANGHLSSNKKNKKRMSSIGGAETDDDDRFVVGDGGGALDVNAVIADVEELGAGLIDSISIVEH